MPNPVGHYKAGTKIEFEARSLAGPVFEDATIGRWNRRINGNPAECPKGYNLVVFQDGGRLLVHETSFRVTDNRPDFRQKVQ